MSDFKTIEKSPLKSKEEKRVGDAVRKALSGFLVILAVGIGVSYYKRLGLDQKEGPEIELSSSQKALLEPDSSSLPSAAHETIVFAGLSGAPPQFIDSGPDRGFGWAEYDTLQIRKNLKAKGFTLKQEWMTPSRITHEFRTGSPICTYPVKWRDPKKVFSSRTNRIYSIPLEIEGPESRKLLFHQEDFPKFKRHLDKKGDLEILSVLKDKSLKTLLIRDFDYGQLGDLVLERNSQGDQVVRQEYADHVILLLVRDNRQLVEMLNARRFDYIFSDAIEDQDFDVTQVKRDRFRELTFQTYAVGSSIRDPRLSFVSIACSIHPLTLKLLPEMNESIWRLRSHEWNDLRQRYRMRLDAKFRKNSGGIPISPFRGIFEGGAADYWYPLQQKLLPTLLLFPPRRPRPERPQIPRVSRLLRWRALSEETGAVTILNESTPESSQPSKNPFGRSFFSRAFPRSFIQRYLSPSQRAFYLNPGDLFEHPSSATDFSKLDLAPLLKSKRLTLFAKGLTTEQLKSIVPLFKDLKEILLFGAGSEETRFLVEKLPPQIERLTMISCSLGQSLIHEKIKELPLKTLHLTDSQVTQRQMGKLISNIPASIIELSLGYHRGAFGEEALKAVESVSWPNLRFLDLENDALYDDQLEAISKAIPPQIKTLRLGLNAFTAATLRAFFRKGFHQLEELDLSQSCLSIPASQTEKLVIPSHVKRLNLWDTYLDANNITKIALPQGLEELDLDSNPIEDTAVQEILSHLAKEVRTLNLSGTRLGERSFKYLATGGQFTKISELILKKNSISDSHIQILSKGKFELQKLDLAGNFLHDVSAAIIAQEWLPRLKSLNLSSNRIGDGGTLALSRKMNPDLLELSLGELVSLDMRALAGSLPKGLKMLDLQGNQISNSEIGLLAPRLPPTLSGLYLSDSAIDDEGAALLAAHLPKHLTHLTLDASPLGNEGLISLSLGFPASLKEMKLGPIQVESSGVQSLASNLPMGLESLTMRLTPASQTSGDLFPLTGSLPRSLTSFALTGTPISLAAARALSSHYPNNMRVLFFSGIPLGDEKIKALAENLPPSVERFALMGAGMGDAALTKLSELPLENLNILEWSENQFSSKSLNAFMSKPRPVWRIELRANLNIRDGLLTSVLQRNLKMLREIYLDSTALTEKGLIPIFQQLNSNVGSLGISSVHLSSERMSSLVDAMPHHLHTLNIRGNSIGETGKAILRNHAQKQERLTGIELHLRD